MQIGPHKLKNNLILAPMAGVTDRPFRMLCKHYGAGMAVSESMLIDIMNDIKNKNNEIKIYSLPKLKPNKTLELGITGAPKNVNKAMKDLRSQLKKSKFNWREN